MTDAYAVIGKPIAHSKSPQIHTAFAQSAGQNLHYGRLEADIGGFATAVDAFRAEGGLGLNVTVPFKLDALAYATEPSEAARLCGAANALKFDGERVLAENFDGVGLTRDVVHNLGHDLGGRRILILGAGGATRGLLLPFLAQGPQCLVVANRSVDKARELATSVAAHGEVTACGYEDLGGERFDLVFNATSASLFGEALPIAPDVFAPDALAYELVYGKGMTPFLHQAQAAGVRHLVDGVGMLVEQAAEAFLWWRGVRPDTAPVIQALTVPLV
jgi:shikimate dehydrogenase